MSTRAEQLPTAPVTPERRESLWTKAVYKFRRDRVGM